MSWKCINLGNQMIQSFKFASRGTHHHSTVFALSSGMGKSGVAVLRVSGPQAGYVTKVMAGFKMLPEPRKAYLRRLRDSHNKTIDRALVLWFPGPQSYTGEDTCEFHVHGGPAVVSSTLQTLSQFPQCRPAEPGEFTKRAFYSGKLDLTAVEAIGDLINAETDVQRQQAIIQMEGALQILYEDWREKLLKCLAHVEAFIDFGEDDNIESDVMEQVDIEVRDLIQQLKAHLCDGRRGEILRNGVKTVVIGEPNVGKSSILNCLTQKPTSIVSSIPGTTRDIVSSTIDLNGFPLFISDTAGLRHSTLDPIELEGIQRAKSASFSADLLLLVIDSSTLNLPQHNSELKADFVSFIQDYSTKLDVFDLIQSSCNLNKYFTSPKSKSSSHKCLIVLNKIDCVQNVSIFEQVAEEFNGDVVLSSCLDHNGVDSLVKELTNKLKELCGSPSREQPLFTQARHRFGLEKCLEALNNYLNLRDIQVDLAAQELRLALNALGQITGHVSPEQVLDVIFKDFCIGK